MTAEERRQPRISERQMTKITLLLFGVGLFLFWRVWCPVQAERASIKLKKIESEVAQKKSELNNLQAEYQQLTTLSVLDRWAKAHGPWKIPSENDVLSITG